MTGEKEYKNFYIGTLFLFLGFLVLTIYLLYSGFYYDSETLGQFLVLSEVMFFLTIVLYRHQKTKNTQYSMKPHNQIQVVLIILYFITIISNIYNLWKIDYDSCIHLSSLGIMYTWVMIGWGWLPKGKNDPVRYMNLFLLLMQVFDLVVILSFREMINNELHFLFLYSIEYELVHPVYFIIIVQIVLSIILYFTKYARAVWGARLLGLIVFSNLILKLLFGFNTGNFTQFSFTSFEISLFFEMTKGVPQIYWSSHFGKYIGGDDPEINLKAFYKQADEN